MGASVSASEVACSDDEAESCRGENELNNDARVLEGWACEEVSCGFVDSGRSSSAAIDSSSCDGGGKPLRGVAYTYTVVELTTSSREDAGGDILSERGDDGEPNIADRTLWAGGCTEGDRNFADGVRCTTVDGRGGASSCS